MSTAPDGNAEAANTIAKNANTIAWFSLVVSLVAALSSVGSCSLSGCEMYLRRQSDKAQNDQIQKALNLGKEAVDASKDIASHMKQDEADGVHLNSRIAEWEWLEGNQQFAQPEKGYLEFFNAGKESVVEVTAFWMFGSPIEGFRLNGEVIKAIDSAEVRPNSGPPQQIMHQLTLPMQMQLLFDRQDPIPKLEGTLAISGKDAHNNLFTVHYGFKAIAQIKGPKKFAHVDFTWIAPLDFEKASSSWGR